MICCNLSLKNQDGSVNSAERYSIIGLEECKDDGPFACEDRIQSGNLRFQRMASNPCGRRVSLATGRAARLHRRRARFVGSRGPGAISPSSRAPPRPPRPPFTLGDRPSPRPEAAGAAPRPPPPRDRDCPRHVPSAQTSDHMFDSLAEWSKVLASGASPQGRGFKPHSCQVGGQCGTGVSVVDN